jgi:predicted HTH transcriptional regulator
MPDSPAALHESETVEFKESFDREVPVSAGALANTRGGTIFIGITDRGNVVGTLRYRIFQRMGEHDLPEYRTPPNTGD